MSKKAPGRAKASREITKKRKEAAATLRLQESVRSRSTTPNRASSGKTIDLTTLQALAYDQAMAQSQNTERQAKELEKQAASLRKEGSQGLEVTMQVILAEHKMDSYPFSPCGIEPLRDEEGRIQQLKFTRGEDSP